MFLDFETCCRGPVEFDLAHAPLGAAEHYPDVDPELLDDFRQPVLALVASWRWEAHDRFPDGRRFGRELLRLLRGGGAPWPTPDTVRPSRL